MKKMKLEQKGKISAAILFTALLIFLSGKLSEFFANYLVNFGINIPLKEFINLAFVLIIFNFIQKKWPFDDKNEKFDFQFSVLTGFFAAIYLVCLSWILLWQFGFLKITLNFKPDWQSQILIGWAFMIVHAFNEQFLLQKIIRPIANNYFNKWAAILMGAFCFILVQNLQGYAAPIYSLNNLIIGMIFIIIGNKTGLWGAVLLHATWSWLELVLAPNIFDFKLISQQPFFVGNDSYGTIILSLIGICLIFALSLIKTFSYKANYDKEQP